MYIYTHIHTYMSIYKKYVCVCVYVYIYIYIYTHTHTHIDGFIYLYIKDRKLTNCKGHCGAHPVAEKQKFDFIILLPTCTNCLCKEVF